MFTGALRPRHFLRQVHGADSTEEATRCRKLKGRTTSQDAAYAVAAKHVDPTRQVPRERPAAREALKILETSPKYRPLIPDQSGPAALDRSDHRFLQA